LRRVERASALGGWSYEVYDCKLACETKAATILQLSLYSELLESIQGVLPESMYVVPPGVDFQPEQYRVLDFAAYYRFVKARLKAIDKTRRHRLLQSHVLVRVPAGGKNATESGASRIICPWSQVSADCNASSYPTGK
jgi:hypothetical protein